jgi:diguanylate cyclase (GGDEF)-like protein
MRLQSKILLTLFPAVMFSLLAIGGISHHLITDHTESVLEGQRDHLFADTIEDFSTFLENTEANATVFSRMKPVQRYLAHAEERGYRDQSAVVRRFKSIQDDHPQYYEIRLFREDGMEDTRVVSRDIDNRAQNEREMPYFERLLQNSESVTRVLFRNPDNHEWALLIGQQILSEGPSMDTLDDSTVRRAFLALTVDMDILQKRSNRSRLGKKGFLYFVDGTGEVLVKPSDSQVLPSLVNLQAVLRADLGKLSFVGVEGNEYKVSGQHLWDNIYGVAVVPAAEFSGVAIKVILVLIFITVTVMMAAALWFHWHIERRFLVPIRHLGSQAKAIGRGDLETKVDVHSDGEIGELAASIREMSGNLKLSQQREKKLAYFDELTGLPNRFSLRQQLDKLIRQSERNGQQFATMFIDLDDFKKINDALGHHLGDRLLQEAADRIRTNLRAGDVITRDSSDDDTPQNMLARLGGDEFTVLLTSIHGAHNASRVAKRILIALAEPFQLQNHQAYVGASIGISIFPGDGSSAEQLLKNADVAMYEAKKSGKNNFQYFTPAMNASVVQRLGK